MFINREIAKIIKNGEKQVPVLAIIGPRQSGKSTLAKHLFNNYKYLDMQDSDLFEFANSDPKGFLNTFKNEEGLIIDEAQYASKLFAQIKVEVDKDQTNGYYVLSGSQNFLLHEKISESLSGRAYFYRLLPFSIKELKSANLLHENVNDQIFKGFYPKVYQQGINSTEYYENYISTYVERDIRSIRNIENILIFRKFMQLCALRVGTTINFSDIAANCGITVNTAKSWLSLLETSFILFLLPSYHSNLGKRITKSPKLYFYDVGLASILMRASPEILIQKRDIFGGLFENMVIVDLIKNLNVVNFPFSISFFRDSNQNEIDLILEAKGKVLPMEIKLSETIQASFFHKLEWFKKETNNLQDSIVIYGGNENQERSKGKVISWKNIDSLLKSL